MKAEELVKNFCPIFYLHSNEPYFPSPWEEIIKMTTLYENDTEIISNKDLNKDTKLVVKNNLKVNKIQDRKYNLKLTHINKKGHLNKPEIQAFITDIVHYKKDHYINIRYEIFYPYNGTLDPHVRDIERMIIRLKIEGRNGIDLDSYDYINPTISRVYLSAHSGGKWFKEKDFEKEDGRIIVYIANESHAYYPEPRIYRRFFRFGDDQCEKGIKYDPSNNVILLPSVEDSFFIEYYESHPEKQIYFYKGQWEGGLMGVYKKTEGFVNYFDCYAYQGGVSNVIRHEVSENQKSLFRFIALSFFNVPFLIILFNYLIKKRDVKVYTIYQYLIGMFFFGISSVLILLFYVV